MVSLLCLLPGVSPAYELDSHYSLRFALSLTTCFNWDEAHLIASGDWGMDENGSTHAEMNPVQTRNKINWHAFGHSDKRFLELWLRSVQEPDLELRLVKLGQFMHFLEDWEAHAGYGLRLGHARDTFRGRDPDSLGNSHPKNHRMVQSALDHLLTTCEDIARLETDRNARLIEIMKTLNADGMLRDLFDASDPDWKRGKKGGFRPEGLSIRAANQKRIEEFIESQVKSLPDKRVPSDFEAGTENGIPPSLRFRFDQNGDIVKIRGVSESLRSWAAESEAAPDVTLSLEDARIYYRGSKSRGRAGWRLLLRAVNQGQIESAAGQIEIVVIDSDDETLLAQASEPLPVLQPGETREFRVSIPGKGRPEPDVIIGTFARIGDLSAMNDEDWLMLGDAEEEDPDVPIITDLDPQPAGPVRVRFMAPPQSFIVGTSACLLATAVVSGGDSTEKLEEVVFEFVDDASNNLPFRKLTSGRWSALSTENGLVGGKTFECFRPEPEAFEVLRKLDVQALGIAVTLEAEGGEPSTEVFPFEPGFYEGLLQLEGQYR